MPVTCRTPLTSTRKAPHMSDRSDRPQPNEVDRLDQLGRSSVPPVAPAFAQRLEADLRTQHATRDAGPRRRWALARPQLVVGALALVVALIGVVGLTARSAQQEGVSVDVLGQPEDGASSISPVFEPTAAAVASPTATPAASTPVNPSLEAVVSPVPTLARPASPTPVVEARATVIPTPSLAPATPGPGAAPTASPAPSPLPAPSPPPAPSPTVGTVATTLPVPTLAPPDLAPPTQAPPTLAPPTQAPPSPTPTAVVEATAVPLPTETPAPTSTPTVAPIRATCAPRVTVDAIGVVCEWQPIDSVDLSGYRVMRVRNGQARELVAEVAANETIAIDRAVQAGDTIVYRVLGVVGDAVRSESEPITVMVPS